MKELQEVEELLVVIDVINGFVTQGPMSDKYIAHIVPGIEELVRKYVKEKNSEVFYIKDAHNRGAIEFKKFPIHCVEGTSESEVVDELKAYENLVRSYKKNSTSAIFAKGLLEDLKAMSKLKRVVVVGCCSDICVLNFVLPLINYFDENDLDITVEVREDLIETYHSNTHDRDEYNEISKKLLKQAGAKITRSEVKKNVR